MTTPPAPQPARRHRFRVLHLLPLALAAAAAFVLLLAFGVYLRAPTGGIRHGTGLDVLTLTGDRICAITHFDNSVLPSFGLPRSLPGR